MERSSDHGDESPKLKKTDIAKSSSGQPQMMGKGPILPGSDAEQAEHVQLGSYVQTLEDTVMNIFPQDMHDQVFCLLEKVKQRICNPNHYQDFLKFIKHYHLENITRQQLQSSVYALLGAHPDLMEEVVGVIDHCGKKDGCSASAMHRNTYNVHVPGLNAKDGNSNLDQDKGCDRDAVKGKRKRSATKRRPRLSFIDKINVKPHKLELSNDCECCNPSYRPISKSYPIPEASQRTEMDRQELNDHWVSVTSKSHDNSLKEPPRDKYEEILFKLEDHRMEIEVMVECLNVTIKQAEDLIKKINADDQSVETDGLFRLEDYFPGPSLWCIRTLYGDEYGAEVVDLLRKNVSYVLQIVLVRLKQKHEECVNWCAKFKELV